MSAVTPLPNAGATLVLSSEVDDQEILCALFGHSIKVTAITVAHDAQVMKALHSVGARVVLRHGRYEVVK